MSDRENVIAPEPSKLCVLFPTVIALGVANFVALAAFPSKESAYILENLYLDEPKENAELDDGTIPPRIVPPFIGRYGHHTDISISLEPSNGVLP